MHTKKLILALSCLTFLAYGADKKPAPVGKDSKQTAADQMAQMLKELDTPITFPTTTQPVQVPNLFGPALQLAAECVQHSRDLVTAHNKAQQTIHQAQQAIITSVARMYDEASPQGKESIRQVTIQAWQNNPDMRAATAMFQQLIPAQHQAIVNALGGQAVVNQLIALGQPAATQNPDKTN